MTTKHDTDTVSAGARLRVATHKTFLGRDRFGQDVATDPELKAFWNSCRADRRELLLDTRVVAWSVE